MKTNFFIFFMVLLLSESSAGQTLIINFDDRTDYNEFEYCDENRSIDFTTSIETRNSDYIYSGRASKKISWNFQTGDFCGWGVIVIRNGNHLDISSAKYLSFWTLRNSDENFQIKIKDKDGVESFVNSYQFLSNESGWQEIRIPIRDFGTEVNLRSIENISLGFNSSLSQPGRNEIWIDEFYILPN